MDKLTDHLATHVAKYLSNDSISIYRWILACRKSLTENAVNIKTLFCTYLPSATLKEEGDIEVVDRDTKVQQIFALSNERPRELELEVEWKAFTVNAPNDFTELKALYLWFEILVNAVDCLSRQCDFHPLPRYSVVFLVDVLRAAHHCGCVCFPLKHDRMWEISDIFGSRGMIAFLDFFPLERSTARPATPKKLVVDEDGRELVLLSTDDVWSSEQRRVPVAQEGFDELKKHVTRLLERHFLIGKDGENTESLRERIAANEVGIGCIGSSDTKGEEKYGSATESEFDDMLIESGHLEHVYRAPDEDVRKLNTELVDGLVTLFIHVRDHLTWETSGLNDRAKFRLDIDAFHNIAIQLLWFAQASRAARDMMQLLVEDVCFGKAWRAELTTGEDVYLVLGPSGSVYVRCYDHSLSMDYEEEEDPDYKDDADAMEL